MPTTPNKALLDRVTRVALIEINGENWPVPPLAPKQNEIVIPFVLEIWPGVRAVRDAEDKFEAIQSLIQGENLKRLYDCLFLALHRGHTELTRDEFDNEIGPGLLDAFAAITPLAQAAGILRAMPANLPEGAPPKGEA